ncbi:MAG: phosphate transport system regulatory protein PhoU [Rhizobiales bacterium]|jgi:phosphate transport system protein|nr:phosphate transport system regulatory protein PhoU [Hyphomicrobiales bacterium]
MSEHIVKSYGEELMELGRKIAEMGGLSETMLSNAIQALVRGDTDLAQRVIETDHRLDVLERDVEEKAILTIAKRQPMAVDLRAIVSSIRLASDMERIGDLSKNIAKRVVAINGQFAPQKIVGGVVHMSELALDRLKRVIDAYAQRDVAAALDVWNHDEEIDQLYNSLFRELLTYMMEDPRNIGFCTHLLFCAKNIERIGDHATNIAETIHYMVTGTAISTDRPRVAGNYAPLDPVGKQ